jgi:3-phosphoshikimate 1-carboxyvinyltransferase
LIVGGEIRVPGDKSLTHRALLLATLARGESLVRGALTSFDARSSARVLRQLGAEISTLRSGAEVTIRGRGRFLAPANVLDCGNSGTTTRLLLGALAGHPFSASLTGDRSLRRRPMRRVTEPLALMGARFSERGGDGLPLTIHGGALTPLQWAMPVSSAQIKSCLLLAGVTGTVEVMVCEPHGRSRDHTERMLRSFGFQVNEVDGWIHFAPTGQLTPYEVDIPGDPSSAAFPVGVALLADGGALRILGVGLNPTRVGFLAVLQRMGAEITVEQGGERLGEPVGDLVAQPSALTATEVSAGEIPALIDEIPMLAALATRARGTTVFRQVGELRVKESDRLGLIAENIRALGGEASVEGDDLMVEGTEPLPRGRVRTDGDHRIAMAFAVLGTLTGAKVTVDDMDCAAVSFPGFPEMLQSIRDSGGRSQFTVPSARGLPR